MQRVSSVLALLSLLAVCALGGAVAPGAVAGSSAVVISQVYGSGGNSGALYQNDYVELLNRGSTTIDLSTWSLQYATAAGVSWQVTNLSGTVGPGRFYLVQLGSAAAIGAVLPTPNAVGTTNVAASGGKLALVTNQNALTCGASAGSCASAASVADLVGYGSAADYEGSGPAPALSATLAALRAGGGCTDTDANAADFATAAPAPRNTSTAAVSCGGSTPPPVTGPSQQASVALDVQPVLSISLEHASLSFGQVATGSTPAPLSEKVTVFSNITAGYSLSVHRTAFSPADLPLGLASTATPGGQVGPALTSGAIAALPVTPAADLLIGTTAASSVAAGDVWPATVGFTGALPSVTPGHYTSTLTFTVIGR